MIKWVKQIQNLKDLPSRGMESSDFRRGYKFCFKQVNSVSSEQQGSCVALMTFQKFQFMKTLFFFLCCCQHAFSLCWVILYMFHASFHDSV